MPTSWTEKTGTSGGDGWIEGIPRPGAPTVYVMFGLILPQADLTAAPISYTERSISATSHTERSVGSTTWTERT